MKFSNHLKPLCFETEHSADYAGYALLVIGLLVFGVALYSNWLTLKQIAITDKEIVQFKQKSTTAKRVKEDADPETQAIIEKVITQSRYPWDALFSTLEVIHTREVSLITIQPSFENKEVMMTAEAENLQQMLAYVSSFEHQENIDHVELLSQELIRDNQKERISFTIMAKLL